MEFVRYRPSRKVVQWKPRERGFQGGVSKQHQLPEGSDCVVTEKCWLEIAILVTKYCREDNLVEQVGAKS